MEKHDHTLNVECPECHHVFDVEASLSQQIEKRLKADMAKGQQKKLDELQKQREEIDKQKQEVASERSHVQQSVDARLKEEREQIKASAQKEAQQAQAEEFNALQKKADEQGRKLSELKKEQLDLIGQKEKLEQMTADLELETKKAIDKEREQIKANALKEAEHAQAEVLQALQKKADAQGQKLSELKKEQLELLVQKEKLEQAKADIELETKKAMDKERKRIEAEVKQREEEAHRMREREHQELVRGLTNQIGDLKRKVEQGSVQLQGDVQELELCELLEDLFRQDMITEVAKGVNGADILELVQDRLGRACGTIAYESKRTKTFSDKWIAKLKEDMQRHHAEIGVIVTETMPKDMTCMGLRDGVFICTFADVRGLAPVLRQSLLRLAEVRSQEENKDAKANLLYAYFTSAEFKQRIQTIVAGYTELNDQLGAEKRAMTKLWKARETHIQRMLSNATELQGSIMGIAGNTLDAANELGSIGE